MGASGAAEQICALRLRHQQVTEPVSADPALLVRTFGAVQAQDYPAALWALGLRLRDSSVATVEEALAQGRIVRTWPMRGTLHFVAPQEVRAMLALLTPRPGAALALRRSRLGVDDAMLLRAGSVLREVLAGGPRSRSDVYAALGAGGVDPREQRGNHVLRHFAHEALICLGPPTAGTSGIMGHRAGDGAGAQGSREPTYALLDSWVGDYPPRPREEALAALASRYVMSHGPVTVADFLWWTGLRIRDARAGLAAAPGVCERLIDGRAYWVPLATDSAPEQPIRQVGAGPSDGAPQVHLLPPFDEYLLGYRDRSASLDDEHSGRIQPGSNGMFAPLLVADGRVVGSWRRTMRASSVTVRFEPFARLADGVAVGALAAAQRYAEFWGRSLEVDAASLESA